MRNERKSTKKLLVIVGPTASGKSEFAVELAKKRNGEVVSADSRQVYKGLEIGSGAVTKKEMRGVPHHLISFVSPKRYYTAAEFQKKAFGVIADIQSRGKLPVLVGGSPLYVYSVADNWQMPKVKPDVKLRKRLEKLSAEQLLQKLKERDPKRAESIEPKNKRRLVRALEILLITKKPIPQLKRRKLPFEVSIIGIIQSEEKREKRIEERFLRMLKKGFLNEVRTLKKKGVSWKRIEDFGFEYKEAAGYVRKKLTEEAMIENVVRATNAFGRRQMLWFKKDSRIRWVKVQ